MKDNWELDLGSYGDPGPGIVMVEHSYSRMLVEVIRSAWERLGFDVIDDEAFFQLVLARIVAPASVAKSVQVLDEIGVPLAHRNTFQTALKRCVQRDYRGQVAKARFNHSLATSGLSLVLYDVTTLYFEAEHEDDLRKVGYSKDRRVDPQIVVGLLVDRAGFPLEVHCFEGNEAETRSLTHNRSITYRSITLIEHQSLLPDD